MREFWIYKDDLDRAEKYCDLGDSSPVYVAFYPHVKYQRPNMVRVREIAPQDEAKDKAAFLLRQFVQVWLDNDGPRSSGCYLESDRFKQAQHILALCELPEGKLTDES